MSYKIGDVFKNPCLHMYTTPKKGWMVCMWGGFWNNGVGEGLTGVGSGCTMWFNTEEERASIIADIKRLASAQESGNNVVVCRTANPDDENVDKLSIITLTYKTKWGEYTAEYTGDYGQSDKTNLYYLTEGNASCPCSISSKLQENHPSFPTLMCWDEDAVEIVNVEIKKQGEDSEN